MKHSSKGLSDRFLEQLEDSMGSRSIHRGMELLRAHRRLVSSLHPAQKNAARFAAILAQWVDIGYESPSILRQVLSRFSTSQRVQLAFSDYVDLRVAEGALAMFDESIDKAMHHFGFVIGLGEEMRKKQLLAITNFWMGRCLRKIGNYDEAMKYTLQGRDVAVHLGYPELAAVMEVLQGWLLFQKRKNKQALEILREAASVLRRTDDYLNRGNIESSYGRMARREGRYQHALDHFNNAIKEYKALKVPHRNTARCLTNIAFVKRLITRQLLKQLDSDLAQRHRASDHPLPKSTRRRLVYRKRFEQLQQEVLAHLKEAEAIYRVRPSNHGSGIVQLDYGYLYLDRGDLNRATSAVEAAYEFGSQKSDYIIMARARILQCMVEYTMAEEEVGEETDSGAVHARVAFDCAKDAVELAKRTQYRGLLAHAYIWQGLTACLHFFQNYEAARDFHDLAARLLKSESQGNTWEDLQLLKAKLLRTRTVDPILRAWSQGSVGEKTFRQINEEFAAIIIPKVWEREGRKISRVASRLSISPKKVRRILALVGRRKPRPS